MRSTVICVDDDLFLLSTLADQLQEWIGKNYNIEKAMSGYEALEIFDSYVGSDTPVSLVISDYIMPGMKGDELLCKLHERDKLSRKIMLTGYTKIDGIINAINNASLYRFVSKPWDKKDLMLTVIQALKSFEQEKNNIYLLQCFEKLHLGFESQLSYLTGTIAGAIDLRCGAHAGHSQHVAMISCEIGKKAGLNSDQLKSLNLMASFHDIGRLVLHDQDLSVIRGNEHTIYDNLSFTALQNEGARKVFSLNPQMDAGLLKGICGHLERYDGTGLRKLKGTDIPVEARIIAIVNYYDNLAASGVSREMALARFSVLKGIIFDPELLEVFRSINI